MYYQWNTRSSLLTEPDKATSSRIAETWQTVLTSKSVPWGDYILVEKNTEMGQIPPLLLEQYTRKYDEYVEQYCSSDSDILTVDEFLNAEIIPFFTGVRSVFGKAHTLKEVSTSMPILESMEIDRAPEVETPSRSEWCSMDYSLFFDVYKSILTYLPTTQPKDYEAMERVKDVLLRKLTV